MSGGRDFGRRVPEQVELGLLLDGVALTVQLFLGGRLVLTLDLRLLFEGALERVSILEVPGARALRLVVGELALEVESVGVDPLAGRELAALPVARHLHARLLELVRAVAGLLSVLPPSGVDVAVLVCEDAFTVAPSVLPVTVVLADSIVEHLADAGLHILFPTAFVAVASLRVPVDTSSETSAVDEVTLVDIAILVGRGTVARETTRARLRLVVLRDELVLAFFSVFRHAH